MLTKKRKNREMKHLLLLMRYVLYCIAELIFLGIFYNKIVFMVVIGKVEVDIIWKDKYDITILVESIRHGLLKRLEGLRSTC